VPAAPCRHEKWTETTAPAKEDSGNKRQDRKLECGIDDWERERASRGLQKKESFMGRQLSEPARAEES